MPDEKYGECVAAWIRLKPAQSATENEIRDYCRGRIAHYKVPAHIRLVDAFPMTVTGKVQKFRIREIEVERLSLQRAAATETA